MNKRKLTKFEKASLYSARAREIEDGAIPKISIKKIGLDKKKLLSKDYVKIAEEEFKTGKLDLEILNEL